MGKTQWVRKVSYVQDEIKEELNEAIRELEKLKTIREGKELHNLVEALRDLAEGNWFGYIKISEWTEEAEIELYWRDTYIGSFTIGKQEPITRIKEAIKERRAKLILDVLIKVAKEIAYIEETKVWEKVDALEETINKLQRDVENFCDP